MKLARLRSLCTPSADVLIGLRQGLMFGAAAAVLLVPPTSVASRRSSTVTESASATLAPAPAPYAHGVRRADFQDTQPAATVRTIADWVADSSDNRGLAFAVLDKLGARMYVFDRAAKLVGTSMVLLGSATGDDTPPGVGDKPLSAIRAHERITPAGRFVSEPGHDADGNDVVWVDYDAAVAMHRVQVIDPKEHRFERITTPSADDKRISNGCINVPIPFFETIVRPTLGRANAIVYVLPEVKPLNQVFSQAYDIDSRRARLGESETL